MLKYSICWSHWSHSPPHRLDPPNNTQEQEVRQFSTGFVLQNWVKEGSVLCLPMIESRYPGFQKGVFRSRVYPYLEMLGRARSRDPQSHERVACSKRRMGSMGLNLILPPPAQKIRFALHPLVMWSPLGMGTNVLSPKGKALGLGRSTWISGGGGQSQRPPHG